MPTTIDTSPNTLNYSLDPIYVVIESDLIASVPSYIEILISSGGPTVGNTMTINWLGKTVVLTVVGTNNENPNFIRDINTGESLDDYADAIAEFLRQNEKINDDWWILREPNQGSARVIRLNFKSIQTVGLSVTENWANTTVSALDISGPAQVDNLRALVEVYEDTGNPEADPPLLKLHAPFDLSTALSRIDISAAFSDLEPDLPAPSNINPTSPTSLYYDTCERNLIRFYFRYAHKGGTPPQSIAMLKSPASYFAVLGSKASDSLTPTTFYRVLHNYRRRDGVTFRKPISCEQPDWVYWLSDNAGETVRVSILLYWSDGTTSTYQPYNTTITPTLNACFKIACGFRQMKLHLVTPTGVTAADAYIVGYDWRLEQVDAPGSYWVTVRYDVHPLPNEFGLYLLMSNGLGGCESVQLKGKVERAYTADRDVFRRSRWPDGRTDPFVQRGDFAAFNQQGGAVLTCNTGWYADPFYLEHLQQLPLSDAWIIDLSNRRFVRVIVESKELTTRRDDETLHSMAVTIRQATIDKAFNY